MNRCARVSTLSFVLVAIASPSGRAQSVTLQTTNSPVTRAYLVGPASGQEQELQAIEDVATGRRITFRTGTVMASGSVPAKRLSGAWRVLLRDDAAPMSNYQWYSMGDAQVTSVQSVQVGSSPNVRKQQVTFQLTGLQWNPPSGPSFTMTVIVQWRLDAMSPYLLGQVTVSTTPALSTLPFYVSQVMFPALTVDRVETTGAEHLVLSDGIGGGILLQDPLTANPFPQTQNGKCVFSGPADNHSFAVATSSLPLLALYNETSKNCLYFSDSDTTGVWRDYEFDRLKDNAGADFLELRSRHMPADVYTRDVYTTLYQMRIRPLLGDWVDVAQTYKADLIALDPNQLLYKGPVQLSMRPEIRDLVFHGNLRASASSTFSEFGASSDCLSNGRASPATAPQ